MSTGKEVTSEGASWVQILAGKKEAERLREAKKRAENEDESSDDEAS